MISKFKNVTCELNSKHKSFLARKDAFVDAQIQRGLSWYAEVDKATEKKIAQKRSVLAKNATGQSKW